MSGAFAAGGKARGQRQGEASRGRGIIRGGGGDLMQGASGKAAREQTIELCLAKRDARARGAGRRMMRRGSGNAGDRKTSDLPAQKAEPLRCTASMRKGLAKPQKLPGHVSRSNVPYLFLYGFLLFEEGVKGGGDGVVFQPPSALHTGLKHPAGNDLLPLHV